MIISDERQEVIEDAARNLNKSHYPELAHIGVALSWCIELIEAVKTLKADKEKLIKGAAITLENVVNQCEALKKQNEKLKQLVIDNASYGGSVGLDKAMQKLKEIQK